MAIGTVKQFRATLNTPAYRLIVATAYRNWSLLALTLLTNLLSALLEGSTLGVIYLAISLLSDGAQEQQLPEVVERSLSIIPLPNELLFLALLGVAVLLQTLLALSNYANKIGAAYLSARAQPQVTGRVFEQIMSFSFACASHYKIGDLVMFANNSAFAVNNQIQTLNGLIVSLTFNIVYAIILVSLSPLLALVAVVLAVVIIVVQRQLLPQLRAAAHQLNSTQVELSKRMTENIQALRLLHTFGTQQRATDEVTLLLREVQAQLQQRAKIFHLPEPILDVLPILSLAILAALAYGMSNASETILPLLVTFLLALQRLSIRLRGIAGAFTQLADNSANMQRLNSILETSDKQFALVGGELFESLQTDICFEEVSLSYTNDHSLALQNLSFRIPKNQVIALVGQSGGASHLCKDS
jgi:subfamily B ATP-binding cassette protein MsbA